MQHPFPLISKKQICRCSKLFCLSLAVVLYDYNAVLYGEMTVVLSYVKQQPASALEKKMADSEEGFYDSSEESSDGLQAIINYSKL